MKSNRLHTLLLSVAALFALQMPASGLECSLKAVDNLPLVQKACRILEEELRNRTVVAGLELDEIVIGIESSMEYSCLTELAATGPEGFKISFDGKRAIVAGHDALGWWRNEAVIMRRSSDNGATWTRPVIVMPDHCPGHQLVAGMSRTSDGRLLQVCDAGPGGEDGSVLHISSDNGHSWVQCKSPIAGIHAGCVSLKDGSFLAFGRGNSVTDDEGINRMPFSISRNNGKSWSVAASCFPPIRGGQRLALLRLLEGPLLMISFDNEGSPSRGMFASLSYDEGKNWTSGKLLTDGVERCLDGGAWTGVFVMDASHAEPKGYLAATQTPDGTIHLISSKNYYKFNLKWLEKQ